MSQARDPLAGRDGDMAAGLPADWQPKAVVRRGGRRAQPEPHCVTRARHQAGPGQCSVGPWPWAMGHGSRLMAGRGATGPVERELCGLPTPLSLQRLAARCIPQVRGGPRAASGRAWRRGPWSSWSRSPAESPSHFLVAWGPRQFGKRRHLHLQPPKHSAQVYNVLLGSCPSRCSFVGAALAQSRSPGWMGEETEWGKRRFGRQSGKTSREMASNHSLHPST